MNPVSEKSVEARAVRAAEEALERQQHVSAIDVLTGMRLLEPVHVDAWRRGRIDFLETMIQGHPKKIALAIETFNRWAQNRGLKATETAYVRATRNGVVDLRFSAAGDPDIDKLLRIHYVSPSLSERRQQKLGEKLSRPEPPVVFEILRDSKCSECGVELEKGSFLLMEAEQPLCLACAHLGELEYLPRGDTALTRRATKYSGTTAVVVRFSRSRGRYERQGILVEPAALQKAEAECSEDAEERAAARARAAVTRRHDDRELVLRMANRITELLPRCPPGEAAEIAAHTAARGSGRVGRSAAGRSLKDDALMAAVRAAVRHNHTDYDALLSRGVDRADARQKVRERVDEVLEKWAADR